MQKCHWMEVVLNVKQGTLRYVINGTDYGNAFDNIDRTAKYRLVVTMEKCSKDCVIQLS